MWWASGSLALLQLLLLLLQPCWVAIALLLLLDAHLRWHCKHPGSVLTAAVTTAAAVRGDQIQEC